jgi:serine/threonine-protein kinase HipA
MHKYLDVYLFQHKLGLLEQDQGKLSFHYLPEWLQNKDAIPLSLNLPLQKEVFSDVKTRAYFANLLPEGDVRVKLAKNLGISVKNDFACLEAIGGECAGAVSLLRPDEIFPQHFDYELLTVKQLVEKIKKISKKPLLGGDGDIRLSLAGAQNKLPIFIAKENYYLSKGVALSSHIVKPQIQHVPYSVENEIFCMLLAGKLGLNVPEVKIIFFQHESFYQIKRYDRCKIGKQYRRLHQEDFCQALSIMPEIKYEKEGGPSLVDCFNLLREYSVQPSIDVNQLLQLVMFNFFIGNADAHAKNISLMLLAEGVKLAPFYDLLSTAIYPDLAVKFAMKVGGENRPQYIFQRHWEHFANSIGVKPKFVLEKLTAMSIKILEEAKKTKKQMKIDQINVDVVDKIIGIIEKRIKHIARYS